MSSILMETDMSNMALAEEYYAAMAKKNLEGMEQTLHPQVQFKGPLATLSGREVVLEGAKRVFSLFQRLDVRARFSSENHVMMVYDLDCLDPIGLLRVSALLSFQDGLISGIELFFDARPFEKK
jgi:hypothetical protein